MARPLLSHRALYVALEELEAGIKEDPTGSNTGPRVRQYLAGCVRDGSRLGLTTGEWCAAFASWCAWTAVGRDEDGPPHLWRAAVWELVEDARAADAWRPIADNHAPRLGDLAVFLRNGGDPTRGGLGHVGRVSRVPNEAGDFLSIEGNHQNRVAEVKRWLYDASLCGWITYPEAAASAELTSDERVQAEGTLALSLDNVTRELSGRNWVFSSTHDE